MSNLTQTDKINFLICFPEYQWCARVIFVESESRALQVRVESWLGRVESESSHKNGRVTSSHWFTSSSQCWVIQISNFSNIFLVIGPPVDLQWLLVPQWTFSGWRSVS